ncbi:MAG: dihydroneopterin aldolase [Desulfotomaculum sp.]|nr:dihydroneopterin aldolase [Desulfotomaculum sp.]
MDKIIMKNLIFYGYHGVLPEEQVLGQEFVVDLELFLNLKPAGETDDLDTSVNYLNVYKLVHEIVTLKKYNLLEALAEKIAREILDNYPVEQINVRVKKPNAPIPGIFDYMAVEITRKREQLKE